MPAARPRRARSGSDRPGREQQRRTGQEEPGGPRPRSGARPAGTSVRDPARAAPRPRADPTPDGSTSTRRRASATVRFSARAWRSPRSRTISPAWSVARHDQGVPGIERDRAPRGRSRGPPGRASSRPTAPRARRACRSSGAPGWESGPSATCGPPAGARARAARPASARPAAGPGASRPALGAAAARRGVRASRPPARVLGLRRPSASSSTSSSPSSASASSMVETMSWPTSASPRARPRPGGIARGGAARRGRGRGSRGPAPGGGNAPAVIRRTASAGPRLRLGEETRRARGIGRPAGERVAAELGDRGVHRRPAGAASDPAARP